jgi:hypothetical protein
LLALRILELETPYLSILKIIRVVILLRKNPIVLMQMTFSTEEQGKLDLSLLTQGTKTVK